MKLITQSRIGKNGTCFRSCIASLLNLREDQVPDFKEANLDPAVNSFLRKYNLRYKEIPAEDDNAPLGLHLALGTSPRGGQHAVVMENGKLLHDPHPMSDDPRRGLVDTKAYGLLLPLKGVANDMLLTEKCGRPQWRTCPECGGRIHRVNCNVKLDAKRDCCKERGCKYSLLSAGKGTTQSIEAKDDKADQLAAEYVQKHNAASKEYKAAFAAVGARMWPMDDAHVLRPSNQRALADSMRRSKGWKPSLPRPLTVLDSYKDVTPKQRKWLNGEVDKIYQKYGGKFGTANDASPLSGKRLHTAAEALRAKHDEIMHDPSRLAPIGSSARETMYRSTHGLIARLVAEAAALLGKAKLDEDSAHWQSKTALATKALKKSEEAARSGDWQRAVVELEAAFTLAHTVIDKMRNTGRAKDMGGFSFGMPRSKEGALRYQEDLKNELAGLAKQDKPSEEDVARIKRIRQYFSVIGKPLPPSHPITDKRQRLHRALDHVMNEIGRTN